jgi:hypothetical protein
VPPFAKIDINKKTLTTAQGKSSPISETVLKQLQTNYTSILKATPRGECTDESRAVTVKNSNLMLSAKVQGEGLFDFINSKYFDMNQQKKTALFEKIGSIALLDLVLHHTDRINTVKCDVSQGSVKYRLALDSENLKSEGTNMNNLMVDSDHDLPVIYAIDNTLDGQQGDVSLDQAKLYTDFLRNLLGQSNCYRSIAQAMAETFTNTLTDSGLDSESAEESESIEESDTDEEPLKPGEKAFLDDLNKFGKVALERGIAKMHGQVSSFFSSSQRTKSMSSCAESSPIIKKAILDRSQIFQRG